MEIKTFWTIVVKSIGLWFLVNCFYIFPQFLTMFSYTNGELEWESLLVSWISTFSIIILFCLIIRLFLFKSEWIIDKLKLDKNFVEQKIDLNISSSTVLSIVVTIIGGVVFVQGLPTLCQQIIEFLQQKSLLKDYSNLSWLVYNFLRTLFGFLIMTNSKAVVKIIEKQTSKN
jgi:hypothetical protein